MSNAGGAWDNAKKSVEDEPRDLKANTGKGSERHKASVVGDTVGDPLKDTAGPALNPMIKVVTMVSLIMAPLIVSIKGTPWWVIVIAVILFAVIAWAIMQSKKEAPLTGAAVPAVAQASSAKPAASAPAKQTPPTANKNTPPQSNKNNPPKKK
jgi:K(+)-stimulated pyrophosphate-energized sodium pump